MAKDSYYDYLRRVPLFADFDDDELDQIGSKATDVNVTAGTVLMREGATAHEMVVVMKGELEVSRDGEHVADIGPGGFAGEMALLTRSHRNSTVTAKTDVELLHIDGREFSSLLDEVPHLAVKMLPIIVRRVTPGDD
jgi:CRP-like cAMP-binding protein